jgi:thermostable 8-oxoguanine DNA glycosylase
MKAEWVIDKETIPRWRKLVNDNIKEQMVIDRQGRNVDREGIVLSKTYLWKVFMGCQITTLSRSGPNTLVDQFLKSNSPALDYNTCRKSNSVEGLLNRELSSAGLRFAPTRASNLARILKLLEDGEWRILLDHLEKLKRNSTQSQELEVVEYLQSKYPREERQGLGLEKVRKKYPGLGPKQARNFIQWIGLSRNEVPLDSRVLKKLKEFGCSFVPSSAALSDETVYKFVQSLIQQIAKKLKVCPCILDACTISSFNKKPVRQPPVA